MDKKFVSLLAAVVLAGPATAAFAGDTGVKSQGLKIADQGRSSATQYANAQGRVLTGVVDVNSFGRSNAQSQVQGAGEILLSKGDSIGVNHASRG
jgi:hypothetical protein